MEHSLTADQKKNFEFNARCMAMDRANGDAFPGPMADAFCETDIVIGEFRVRKVTASDWAILRKLDSPIHKLMEEIRQDPESNPNVDASDEEEFEICFQFTRHQSDSRKILSLENGRNKYREQASVEIGDKCDPVMVKRIVNAVMVQIQRSFATALKHVQESGEDEVPFPAPPAKTA